MSRILLILICVFSASGSWAQTPWQGFLPGRTAHYAVQPAGALQIDSVEAVYEPVRFDSSFSHGPNRFYVPMKVTGTTWWSYDAQWNYPNVHEPQQPWYGPIVRTDSAEEEYFPRAGGSFLLRRNRLHVNDTALTWMSGPGKLYGICTGLDTATVLTESDSIAMMRLVHRDSAGAAGPWNGRTLKLSRTHGWVQALNFHGIQGDRTRFIDADTLYRRLAFLSGSPVDYPYPPYSAWHAYRIGDVMHTSTYRFRDMAAQCWSGPACGSTGLGNGVRAEETEKHHRRLIGRISNPAGDSLIWLDSFQVVCRVMYGMPWPDPVIGPLVVQTVKEALPDSTGISSLSFQRSMGPQGQPAMGMPLVRQSGRMVRLDAGRGLSGGWTSTFLHPFGNIYWLDGNSPQGWCKNTYAVQYATCNGDTLGQPSILMGVKRIAKQVQLVSIAPNPTTGLMRVKALSPKLLQLELIRLDGAVLKTETIRGEAKLDLSHLPPGMYAWRAREGGYLQTGRLIKE